MQVSQRAFGCRCLSTAELTGYSSDVSDDNVCHYVPLTVTPPHSNPATTSFTLSSQFSIFPFPPAQRSGEGLPHHQASSHQSEPQLRLGPRQQRWPGVVERRLVRPRKPAALRVPAATPTPPSSVHTHELFLLLSPYTCEYGTVPLSLCWTRLLLSSLKILPSLSGVH